MAAGPATTDADARGDSKKNEIIEEFVKYSFFKIDRAWRHLPDETKRAQKEEFATVIEEFADAGWFRTYSCVGFRADADLLVRQISLTADVFQTTMARLVSTSLGRYLDQTYSYLAMNPDLPIGAASVTSMSRVAIRAVGISSTSSSTRW
jgi:chlorite dismutase